MRVEPTYKWAESEDMIHGTYSCTAATALTYLDSFDSIFHLEYSSLWRECIDTPAVGACTRYSSYPEIMHTTTCTSLYTAHQAT